MSFWSDLAKAVVATETHTVPIISEKPQTSNNSVWQNLIDMWANKNKQSVLSPNTGNNTNTNGGNVLGTDTKPPADDKYSTLPANPWQLSSWMGSGGANLLVYLLLGLLILGSIYVLMQPDNQPIPIPVPV